MSYGTLISTVTVGAGGAASIAFSSIPQTYTDLLIVYSTRDTAGTGGSGVYNDINITVNSQTAASGKVLYTITGTSAASYSPAAFIIEDAGNLSTANTFANVQVYIPNYTSTGVKAASSELVIENNAAACNLNIGAYSITNGAAITSISLAASTSFVQYSTASLYGIK